VTSFLYPGGPLYFSVEIVLMHGPGVVVETPLVSWRSWVRTASLQNFAGIFVTWWDVGGRNTTKIIAMRGSRTRSWTLAFGRCRLDVEEHEEREVDEKQG